MSYANETYVDFVIIRHEGCDKKYLFYAPAFSRLEKGDLVKVETKNGVQLATVVSSMTVKKDDQRSIDFVMESMSAPKEVKRVLSRGIFSKFEYEEENDERPDNN